MSDKIRPYGPGKFSTILDSYVYQVSLDGGCDDEAGNVDEFGYWYGLMRRGRSIFRNHDPLLEILNEAEQKQLTESAGVIMCEDSNGFVSVNYYQSATALDEAWDRITDEFEELEEDEPEEGYLGQEDK